MAQQDPSVSERTSEALKQLQPVAAAVEAAAAELSKPVSAIETAIKRMNIGYEAWTTYKQGSSSAEGEEVTPWNYLSQSC